MKPYNLYLYQDVALESALIPHSNMTYSTAKSTEISPSIKTAIAVILPLATKALKVYLWQIFSVFTHLVLLNYVFSITDKIAQF
jgi:hypothetical protein